MSRVVWHNGQLIPESEARVSIYDSALMFGDMVFEMTRSFHRQHFKLREHIARLRQSCELTRQTLPYSDAELYAAINRVTELNAAMFQPDDEHRLLVNVSRGPLGLYAGRVDASDGPQVMIANFPLRWTVQGMGTKMTNGVDAWTVLGELTLPEAKHRSRLAYQLANARMTGSGWAVMVDTFHRVSEGTGANFFWVDDEGRLCTPDYNCLRGISRQYVLDVLAPELGLTTLVTSLFDHEVTQKVREAFFTATPFCILPIRALDGKELGVGSITKRLLNLWSENEGLDIAAQIRSWDAQPSTITGPTPYQFR